LTLLNENPLQISNDERLRSLTVIHCIAGACFSVFSCEAKYGDRSSKMKSFERKCELLCLEFREDLRMRLLIDIGKFLGRFFYS